jgi:hypothetical protein
VRNRFQNVPIKCNVHRYSGVVVFTSRTDKTAAWEANAAVGLCRLNQADP